MVTEVVEGKYFERLPGETITFREMMERYLAEVTVRKAPGTQRAERSIVRRLIAEFGDLTVAEITPKLLSNYKTKRVNQGTLPATINHELQLLNHAFNIAIREWEWIKENPVSKIKRERVNNLRDRWLTLEEEERLLEASPEWLRDIITFAIYTGLRKSEILNLRWKDVDLFRKVIYIGEQKNRGKDTLPLNSKALGVLRKKSKVRHINCEYVFHTQNGTKIDPRNLNRAFYSSLRKAEIKDLRFHDLRHTFATRLVQAGVDIYTVQKLCRWKTISMAMRYAHHYPESLRPGVEAITGFRGCYVTNLPHSGKGSPKN